MFYKIWLKALNTYRYDYFYLTNISPIFMLYCSVRFQYKDAVVYRYFNELLTLLNSLKFAPFAMNSSISATL